MKKCTVIKIISISIMFIMMVFPAANAELSATEDLRDQAREAYQAVLEEYINICKIDKTEYLENEDVYNSKYPNANERILFYFHTYRDFDFFYAYKDIDRNGIDELFISAGNEEFRNLVDLYLFDGNKAIKAIENDTLGDRSSFTLYTDGTLYETASNGAADTTETYYRINDDGTALEVIPRQTTTHEDLSFDWILLVEPLTTK